MRGRGNGSTHVAATDVEAGAVDGAENPSLWKEKEKGGGMRVAQGRDEDGEEGGTTATAGNKSALQVVCGYVYVHVCVCVGVCGWVGLCDGEKKERE